MQVPPAAQVSGVGMVGALAGALGKTTCVIGAGVTIAAVGVDVVNQELAPAE
jgi:hypothetical protein